MFKTVMYTITLLSLIALYVLVTRSAVELGELMRALNEALRKTH